MGQLNLSESYNPRPYTWGTPMTFPSNLSLQTKWGTKETIVWGSNAVLRTPIPPPLPTLNIPTQNDPQSQPQPQSQSQPQSQPQCSGTGTMVSDNKGLQIPLSKLIDDHTLKTSNEILEKYLPDLMTAIHTFRNSRAEYEKAPLSVISSMISIPLNDTNVANVLFLCMNATNLPLTSGAALLRKFAKDSPQTPLTVYGIDYASSTISCIDACSKALNFWPIFDARFRPFI